MVTQHQRHGQAAGDEVRPRARAEHRVPAPGRLLPERATEVAHVLVATPDVVDEHVEATVLGPHAVEERLDLRVARVVDVDGDALSAAGTAPCGRQLGGLGERLRHVLELAVPHRDRARRASAGGAPGRVDGRAALGEHERDAAPTPRLAPVTTATRPRRSGPGHPATCSSVTGPAVTTPA
jgi:hypothetical protein